MDERITVGVIRSWPKSDVSVNGPRIVVRETQLLSQIFGVAVSNVLTELERIRWNGNGLILVEVIINGVLIRVI